MIRTLRSMAASNWFVALLLMVTLSLSVGCGNSSGNGSGNDDDPAGECEVGDCADDVDKQEACETAVEVCRALPQTPELEEICVNGAILDVCGEP